MSLPPGYTTRPSTHLLWGCDIGRFLPEPVIHELMARISKLERYVQSMDDCMLADTPELFEDAVSDAAEARDDLTWLPYLHDAIWLRETENES